MADILLQTYHRLPGFARSMAASARGFHLRRWRYGPETGQLVDEALEREHWTPEKWKSWQEERLAFVLHRAATRVPFYRDQWTARRRRGDRSSWKRLENWPVLEKEPLRQNPRAFVAEDCDVRGMYAVHTSGTTGKPLDLWRSRETVRAWYALFEARSRRWYGVSRENRWAILGGQVVAPASQSRPPFWVWNAALNQLYMSSYHLAPDLIPHYFNALRKYEIKYLYGYTSSLHALAQEAHRLGGGALPMTVVVTNAEPLAGYQRRTIGEAFSCPVRETYGMAEIVAGAGECEGGRLHLWPEAGWLEVLEGDAPAPPGESGDLVCTGLLNADMPLIRYRVGDRGRLPAVDEPCPCGRTLPVLASVEGRSDDILQMPNGRRIGRLDPVLKGDLPIREAQIIQDALDRVTVRYVPAPGFTPEVGRSVIERLRSRLGEVNVVLEPVNEIPRSANGKFRAVICNLRNVSETRRPIISQVLGE